VVLAYKLFNHLDRIDINKETLDGVSHDFIEVPNKEAHATLCNFRLHLFQLLLRRINIKRNRRLVKWQEPLVFLYFG